MSDLAQCQAKANKAIEQLIAQLRHLNDQYFDSSADKRNQASQLNQEEIPLMITDKAEVVPPSSP